MLAIYINGHEMQYLGTVYLDNGDVESLDDCYLRVLSSSSSYLSAKIFLWEFEANHIDGATSYPKMRHVRLEIHDVEHSIDYFKPSTKSQ